jgi:ABC-type branched-subunit amino acid transport system ATPase component
MSVYIERVDLQNYRSCKKATFELNENLSALIGANGAGKSNVLNGILLLKKIARVSRVRHDDDPYLSSCKLSARFNVDGVTTKYEALIEYATNERNIDEVVTATEKWNFKEISGQGRWLKLPMSFPRDMRTYQSSYRRVVRNAHGGYRVVAYNPIDELKLSKGISETISNVIRKILEFVDGISYYSASRFTDPSKCPSSFELESERLSRRIPRMGDEHLQFMFDLYSAYKNDKSEFDEFISLVGSEGIGLVDAIEYAEIDVPSNIYQVVTGGRVRRQEVKRVLVIPNIIIGGNKLSPNQLSEGTFKTLGILFYIITDKSRLLLLEEPEVCVHHGLLASIMEIIKSFSLKKQIIISTHSDFVLDALDPSNVFVVRNYSQKGTIVKHVPSSMSARDYKALKQYLNSVGNLGEYWRNGELEG